MKVISEIKKNKIQVTLDGSNSDLSKFLISRSETAVPFFYSIKLSKFTPYLSNFRSLEVLYLSNQDLGPVTHISLFFTLHLSKLGRLYTPVKRVIITPAYLDNGKRRGLAWTC